MDSRRFCHANIHFSGNIQSNILRISGAKALQDYIRDSPGGILLYLQVALDQLSVSFDVI